MHQPARLEHVDGALLGPAVEDVPPDALVGGGVGDGDALLRMPLEGDQADVAVAHGALAEEVDAVF